MRPSRVALALSALVVVLPFAARPLIRSRAESRARALGLDVEIGSVAPFLGVARLRGVTVRAREVPSVVLSVDEVRVTPSLLHGISRVEAHGGSVRIQGTPAEVKAQVDAARAARRSTRGRDPASRTVPVLVDGLGAVWTDPALPGRAQRVWGARLERRDDGTHALGADLVRLEHAGARVEVVQGRLEIAREGGSWLVRSASTERVTTEVDLDGPSHARPAAALGAASAAAPAGQGGVAGRALRAREGAERAAALVLPLLGSARDVALPNLFVRVHREGQTLNIGPATLVVGRRAARLHVGVRSGASAGTTPLVLDAEIPVAAGPIDATFAGGPLSLAALGVKEGDMGLLDVARSTVDVDGNAHLSEDGKVLAVSGSSRFVSLSLEHPKLAPEPVRGLDVGAKGRAELSLDGSRATLSSVELTLGKVRLGVRGTIERGGGHARGSMHLEVPLTACADWIAAIPPALAPLFRGVKVTGTFAFHADLELDTKKLGDTRVSWDGENGCRITEVPPDLSPERFQAPWVRTVLAADGLPTTTESGPGTSGWVRYTDISQHVTTAVVVCEDSRFFSHHGFDQKSISDSVRDNLRAGRFVRGGSTVSMQLAKNLFLTRDKTLSRKLQEAGLTLLLEQALTKEQLLELYLNVVELGPGIYGIGPAARTYFGVDPKDLTLAQSFYLVSVLPKPKQHHFAPDGSVHPGWWEYLKKLMTIGNKIRRVTDAELAQGLAEEVRFAGAAAGATGERAPEAPDSQAPEWFSGDEGHVPTSGD